MAAELDLLAERLNQLQGKDIILHYFNYSYSCDEGDDDERSDTCIKEIHLKLHGILGYEHQGKGKIAFVLAEPNAEPNTKPISSADLQVYPSGTISGSASWVGSSSEKNVLSKITQGGKVLWDCGIPQFPYPGGFRMCSGYVKQLGKEISDLITDPELKKKVQAQVPTLRRGESYLLPKLSPTEYSALEKYLIRIV